MHNYTEYTVAYEIGQKIRNSEVDNLVDKQAAHAAATRWVMLHEYNITQEVKVIIEHFQEYVAGMLGGAAKAMIVTSSRKHALRYHKAIEKYLAKHHIDGITALVAFSGIVSVIPGDTWHRSRPASSGQ